MKVYIAGPYSKGDVAVNVSNAIKAADMVLAKGHIPYIPHLTHFWHIVSPKPYQIWLDIDMEFLKVCDVVLRLPGESTGADGEVDAARRLGIPVYHDIKWL